MLSRWSVATNMPLKPAFSPGLEEGRELQTRWLPTHVARLSSPTSRGRSLRHLRAVLAGSAVHRPTFLSKQIVIDASAAAADQRGARLTPRPHRCRQSRTQAAEAAAGSESESDAGACVTIHESYPRCCQQLLHASRLHLAQTAAPRRHAATLFSVHAPCVHMRRRSHAMLGDACECARLGLGWLYRHPRARNAQVSRCICYVGLSRNWGSIPNGLPSQ